MARSFHAILVSLLCLSCGDSGSGTDNGPIGGAPDGGGGTDPKACEMRLGSGVRHFEAVSDGATVFLYKGPQGGFMFYLAVQAKGFNTRNSRICWTYEFANGGGKFGDDCLAITLPNDLGDGWFERVGVWGVVFTDYWAHSSQIMGQDVSVHVTLSDDAGCSAEGGWDVHVSPERGM